MMAKVGNWRGDRALPLAALSWRKALWAKNHHPVDFGVA